MVFSKINTITAGAFPSEWNGKFENNKITENIVFNDGSTMSLVFELENSLESFITENNLSEDDQLNEYEEDEDGFEYVTVEENGNSFLIHKDVLDVYMEMME